MMLFFVFACISSHSTSPPSPIQSMAIDAQTKTNMIVQIDDTLNIVENDDSIERLYFLRDLISELESLSNADLERLQFYLTHIVENEKKNAAEAFEIDMNFPEISNDAVITDLSEQEMIFKQSIQTLFEQQNFLAVLEEIEMQSQFKNIVYPIFVEVRDIYVQEQTEEIQQLYTQMISENFTNNSTYQELYDRCLTIEKKYPEADLTLIIDIRYRLQKILQNNPTGK